MVTCTMVTGLRTRGTGLDDWKRLQERTLHIAVAGYRTSSMDMEYMMTD